MALKLCVQLSSSAYRQGFRHFHTSRPHLKIVPFVLSDIGEGIREVTVRDWFVKVGDTVRQFDDICLVESDKAAVNITSRFDGVITKIYHDEGTLALVGEPLVDIDTEEHIGRTSASASNANEPSKSIIPDGRTEGSERDAQLRDDLRRQTLHEHDDDAEDHIYSPENKSLATPAVRRIAKQYKITLSDVKGSGKSGRVLKEDVLNFLERLTNEKQDEDTTMQRPRTGGDTLVPVTGIRKAMAKAMVESHSIPSFGYSDEFDVTKLVALRKEIKSQMGGVNITYMPFFIKALSNSLSQHPELNAHVDSKCENIVIKSEHNIGLAVDTPNGLLVPNIKSVQNKSILEISSDLNKLIEKAKNRTLAVQDLTGGTITISNIGIIGGTYARPLINPPELAIVAIGRFRKRPVYDEHDHIVAAHTCNVSWSADHRVVDGASLARLSELWKEFIENPLKLLIDP